MTNRTDVSLLYLSAISIGEIRFGIQLLAPGARRRRLAGWPKDDLHGLTLVTRDAGDFRRAGVPLLDPFR